MERAEERRMEISLLSYARTGITHSQHLSNHANQPPQPPRVAGAKEAEWSFEIDRSFRGGCAPLQSLIDIQTMQTRLLLRPVQVGFI